MRISDGHQTELIREIRMSLLSKQSDLEENKMCPENHRNSFPTFSEDHYKAFRKLQ